MSDKAVLEFTRREALIVAAGGVAAALDRRRRRGRADDAGVSGLVFEDKDGSGKPGAGQSRPRRRAGLQRHARSR